MKGFVSMAGQATWAGELRPESVPILARAGAVCIIRSPSLDQAFDAEKQAMIKDVIAAAQEAGRLIEKGMSRSIAQKRVTYDFHRLMDGATELKCSEFGDAIIENLGG